MKTVAILVLIACVYSLNAQILSGYGVKLGAGISNQSWVYTHYFDMKYDNKTEIAARIFADIFDFYYFGIEGEIGYLRKGFTEKISITTMERPDGTGEFLSVNNSLDYLSLSVLIKYKYDLGVLSPYIVAGPQLNYLIHKNIDKWWGIVFDKFRENNVGLSLGVGSEINNILPVSLLAEYRYERDFQNNFNKNELVIKNYSHVLMMGLRL